MSQIFFNRSRPRGERYIAAGDGASIIPGEIRLPIERVRRLATRLKIDTSELDVAQLVEIANAVDKMRLADRLLQWWHGLESPWLRIVLAVAAASAVAAAVILSGP